MDNTEKLTNKFIEDSTAIFGTTYDYSKVVRKTFKDKVCVICPIHGEFYVDYNGHVHRKSGCPKCKKDSREKSFLERAKKKYNNLYDYSKVKYIDNKTKVCIICPKHGEFWKTPTSHLQGKGCPRCKLQNYIPRLPNESNQEFFIRRANIIHNNKYDYSKVEYVNNSTKVCIICPEHGEFWQIPNDHTSNHSECPKCAAITRSQKTAFSNEEAINRLKLIHGDKYDYSKVVYKNNRSWIKLICPTHGEFQIKAEWAFKGRGCKKCSNEARKLNTEIFIQRAKEIHGDKYDYSLVNYIDYKTPVRIICPDHGEFWQTPNSHLGVNPSRCPKCSYVSKGELNIHTWLTTHSVDFDWQYLIETNGRRLYADFYIKGEKPCIIEYNGTQHYKQCSKFHLSEKDFKDQIERDLLLKNYCFEHNIFFIEIPEFASDEYTNYILTKYASN